MRNIETIKRYYDAFNRRDLSIYEALFTADCVIRAPGMEMTGLAAMREFDKVWGGALPDGTVVNLVIASNGEYILCNNRITGHHNGPFVTPQGTLPPTGRLFDEEYFAKFTFAGEKIKVQALMFDRVRVMEVLGPK